MDIAELSQWELEVTHYEHLVVCNSRYINVTTQAKRCYIVNFCDLSTIQ